MENFNRIDLNRTQAEELYRTLVAMLAEGQIFDDNDSKLFTDLRKWLGYSNEDFGRHIDELDITPETILNEEDCQYQLYIDEMAKGNKLSAEMKAEFLRLQKMLGYKQYDSIRHIVWAKQQLKENG